MDQFAQSASAERRTSGGSRLKRAFSSSRTQRRASCAWQPTTTRQLTLSRALTCVFDNGAPAKSNTLSDASPTERGLGPRPTGWVVKSMHLSCEAGIVGLLSASGTEQPNYSRVAFRSSGGLGHPRSAIRAPTKRADTSRPSAAVQAILVLTACIEAKANSLGMRSGEFSCPVPGAIPF